MSKLFIVFQHGINQQEGRPGHLQERGISSTEPGYVSSVSGMGQGNLFVHLRGLRGNGVLVGRPPGLPPVGCWSNESSGLIPTFRRNVHRVRSRPPTLPSAVYYCKSVRNGHGL